MFIKKVLSSIPREIKPLVCIKIFTTYSFAVLYSSLVLYMTKDSNISSHNAAGVMGVFLSLNFILHFFGGYVGGKFISNRSLLTFGMLMELLGILLLQSLFFVGLGVFLTGSGLYATSINAIMLQRFEPNDDRRELASFWIYSAMNLGFFLGHTVSGYFHNENNYNALFKSSILTSIIALLLILSNWTRFADKTTELTFINNKAKTLRTIVSLSMVPFFLTIVILSLVFYPESGRLVMLFGVFIFCVMFIVALKQPTQVDKNKVFAFLILVASAIVFWSLFFIGPMGLTLFIKDYVDLNIFGITIPPQWFNNINTSIIVFGGPFLAVFFQSKRDKGKDLSFPFLFSISLLLIGTSYIILPLGIFLSRGGQVSMVWVILSYVLQTLGELFLSPVGVAMVGKLAPKGKQGLLLGIWAMVSGIASMISKYISQMMIIPVNSSSSYSGSQSFSYVFNMVGWGAFIAGIILYLMVPYVNKLISEDKRAVRFLEEKSISL